MNGNPTGRRNLAQRLLAGAAWAFGAKICGMGSSLVVNAVLARMLTADEMGVYFLTVSVTMFAAIVASFGLRQTVVRLIAESLAQGLPGRARVTLVIVFTIAGIGAALVASSYYLGINDWLSRTVFQMPLLVASAGLTALWIVVLTFQTPVAETFRGLHDIRLAVFLDGILANTLLAGIVIVLLLLGYRLDYETAILASVTTAAISLLFGLTQLWRRRNVFAGEGSIQTREVMGISAPMFVTNLANYGINQFSLWVVAAYLAAEDVALYGAAWRLVSLLALPLMLMNMTVNPVIAELNATSNKHALQDALRGTATLSALPTLAVLILYVLYGGDLLAAVFGAPYHDAYPVLWILCIGMAANAWTGSCAQVLAITGHQRLLMNMTLATGVLAVTLAVLGVRYMGVAGVAWAVTTGRIAYNIIGWWLVYKATGLWTHGTLHPTFIRKAARRVLEKNRKVV